MSLPNNSSPTRNNSPYTLRDGGRWTVDNSESRFLKSSINSPKKSILKGSRTPNTFFRPHFFHSQEQRQRLLQQVERRVSFAPDPSIRTFNENEASSSVNRDTIVNQTQRSHFSQMFGDNMEQSLHPNPNQDTNQQYTILSGSPIHRRKRTSDLLGSPLGNEKSPKLNFGQKVRLLAIDRLKRDEEGNDEDTLMRFLENSHQKGKRNIFEDIDDEIHTHHNSDVEHTNKNNTVDLITERTGQSKGDYLKEQENTLHSMNSVQDLSQLTMSEAHTINIDYENHITQESPPSLLNASIIGRGDNDTQDVLFGQDLSPNISERIESNYYDAADNFMLQDFSILDTSDMELTQENQMYKQALDTLRKERNENIDHARSTQSADRIPGKNHRDETVAIQSKQTARSPRPAERDNIRQDYTSDMQLTQEVQQIEQDNNDDNYRNHTIDMQLTQEVQNFEHDNNGNNYVYHNSDMQPIQNIQSVHRKPIDINREDSDMMQLTQEMHPLKQPLVGNHLEEAVDMQLTQETRLFKPDVPDDYYQEEAGMLPTQEVEPFKTTSTDIGGKKGSVNSQPTQYSRPVTPVFPRTHQGTIVDRRLIEGTIQLSPILPVRYQDSVDEIDDIDDVDDMQITQEARQYDPFYSTYNQEKSPTQTTKSNQLFNHKATTDSHQDEYDDDYMQITQDTTPLDRMRINHNESFNYPEQSSNLAKESTQEVGNSLPNTPETQRRHTLDQTHGQSLIFEDPVDQTVSIEDTQPIHSPLRQSTASHINMGYTTPLALRELSSVRHSVNYLSPFSSLRSRSAIRPQSFHGRSGFRSAISHRTSSIHPEHGTTPNHSEFLFESSIGQSNRNPIYLNASQTSRRRRSLGNSEADVFSREQDSSMDIYNQTTENILGIDIEGLYESPRVEPLFPTQMSLPSFLKHIGIRFEENISNDNRPPTTFSVEEATPATMAEQAATAATTLPQLEIYKKMCIDMRNTQMHCKEVVENIYREKDIESQQLSKEFFSSDANSRCEMINRLKLIKQLSLMKSKTIVDEQRSSQIEGLNERLRSTYEKLKQDVNYNNTFENNLEEKLPEFYAYKYRVNSAFGEAKKREETYNKVDHEAMGRLEVEIDEQRAAMQVFREQNEELESEEFQLRERSEALQQRKVELLEALELAKKIREENKYSTENDVAQAKERFKNNASKLQLNIIKKTEETTEVVISNDIRVTINIKELKKNPCEAVSVRVEENRKNVHEEFTELIHGINMIIKDEKNQYKVLQKIIFYWHRVRAIRREIVFVGWRFESVLKPLTGESLTPDKRGVRVDITVFSYVSKVKFKLSLQFVSNDIFLYPALDLSNVEIVVSYGDVPVEKLRGLLAENGIVNLERTLCNFLSSLQNK